ncbi:MAG: F0F1 ATP synthase subunit epsilon [Candidatus Abyssobacteria bacterium SURF_5]|uniref:F0F1 ATP synthase subunit epsilon n=1 Tax=Abyssobacteria bacterium (strain SURF_5) TaxID=2093360 RepID=A0A3A4NGE3_ABYX5|nr:MAG: F0F1 ATP synthase subunit epsilon [Candidatus Abyssubacteria bacterium SURF_5]
MRLKILLPTSIFLDRDVSKVTAEAANGSFTLLPRHIDFLAALVPGLLSYKDNEGEVFLAVDEGILVKRGDEVLVSTRGAVRGPNLGQVKQMLEESFESLDEREKKARSAVARIEAGIIRRFTELRHYE